MHDIQRWLQWLIRRRCSQTSRPHIFKSSRTSIMSNGSTITTTTAQTRKTVASSVHIKISSGEKWRAYGAGGQRNADSNVINGETDLQMAPSSSSLLVGSHSACVSAQTAGAETSGEIKGSVVCSPPLLCSGRGPKWSVLITSILASVESKVDPSVIRMVELLLEQASASLFCLVTQRIEALMLNYRTKTTTSSSSSSTWNPEERT